MNKKIFSACLITLCIISLYVNYQYTKHIKLYNIDEIIIEGNDFLSNKIIQELISHSFSQINLLDINIKGIQNKLNQNTYIKASKVFTSLPSKLIVHIKEIEPLVLYEQNKNYFFIDSNNKHIIANNKSMHHFTVPILRVNNNNKIDYKNITGILRLIKNKDANFYNTINEIIVEDESTSLSIYGNTIIQINNKNKLQNISKLLSFINSITGSKKISDYKYVDLTIPKQIIVKEKNSTIL